MPGWAPEGDAIPVNDREYVIALRRDAFTSNHVRKSRAGVVVAVCVDDPRVGSLVGRADVKRVQPGSSGADAGTTVALYYGHGGSGLCSGHPEWAGLACTSGSAAAPAGGSGFNVMTLAQYGTFLQPTMSGDALPGGRTRGAPRRVAKLVARNAYGFRNPANQRLRVRGPAPTNTGGIQA